MKTIFFLSLLTAVAFGAKSNNSVSAPKDRAFCNVSMMGGFTTTGGRCRFFDEVMTGIVSLDPLTIRCSRVNVTCNRDGKAFETVVETDETSEE